jgi:hypothetical protein
VEWTDTMAQASAIEAALAAWREADRRLAGAVGAEAERPRADVIRHRDVYQRLAAESMADWLQRRVETEQRLSLLPSSMRYGGGASR